MSIKALVGNAADPEQVKEAEGKERFEVKEQVKDLRFLLSTPQGKRFIWRALEQCSVFKGGFAAPDQLMFREGERNIGTWLLAQITEANPHALIEMMKEREKDA